HHGPWDAARVVVDRDDPAVGNDHVVEVEPLDAEAVHRYVGRDGLGRGKGGDVVSDEEGRLLAIGDGVERGADGGRNEEAVRRELAGTPGRARVVADADEVVASRR